jgi:hypothetical protein
MVAVTYGVARVPAGKAEPKAEPTSKRAQKVAPAKGWFARFLDAVMEARMQQARREIALHARLMLPYSLDERDNRLVKRGKTVMPFGGW